MTSTLTHAFKEWAVAINALESGKTILLLRKGGIKEVGKHFQVKYQKILLYPTFEHQQPNLLKPEYASLVTPVNSGWHLETVSISSWAEITHILPVNDSNVVASLFPYHIWNEQFVRQRLNWKPHQSLYLLLLRTHKLAHESVISYSQEYGGCQSWINLVESVSLEESLPVLSDNDYSKQVGTILRFIADASKN